MKGKARHPLVAVLLIVVLIAIFAPLLQRDDSVVSRPLDMTLPPVPEMPLRDALPPVSNAELAATEEEINAAREQLRSGPSAPPTPFFEQAVEPSVAQQRPAEEDVLSEPEAEQTKPGPLPIPAAWAVEVAIMTTEAQAQQQKLRLLDSGYSAYLRALPDNSGWQLLAGPELKYSAAQDTQARLKFDPQWQIESRIVPFSP